MNKLTATLVLPLLLASCQNIDTQENGYGTLEITLSVPGTSATKAHVSSEKRINSVKLFIFDIGSGTLERVISSDESGDGTLVLSEKLKCGSKRVWAYANYDVNSAEGYGLACHPLPGDGLADNSFEGESFAMRGSCMAIVNGSGSSLASVTLSRTACRTVIKSIRNSLPNSLPLEILGAYLADVYIADTPNSTSSAAPFWANKWGRGTDFALVSAGTGNLEYEGLTCWFGPSVSISNGSKRTFTLSSSEKGSRLYSMPNTLDTDRNDPYAPGSGWTPRLTKLVIVARISGNLCYYSIPMEDQNANDSAEYDINIYGIGTDDPETVCTTGSCSVSRSVKAWEDGASYTDDSTPEYKTGVITSQAGHTSACHVAQRMYLQMPVSDQNAAVRSGISFTASLSSESGAHIDATSWISASYESGNQVWKLNIACRSAGELEVKAVYDGNVIARTTRSILSPVCNAEVEPLLITGSGKVISCNWHTTDGTLFDSALYTSLLDGGSVEFDTSFPGSSMLGTYTSGGNRYMRVKNLNGMADFIAGANADESFTARSRPLLARFRVTAPCGIKSAWTEVRICNWWANFYSGGEIAEFTYIDNECYNADIELFTISDGMSYPSPNLAWKWISRWGYNFGCGNSLPFAGASSRVSVSSGKLRINNSSSAIKCNAAGMSQITAAFTNSVSGQTLELPCMDVRICKTFYFRSTVDASWDITYSAPDVSAFSADIPVSPVRTPIWSAEARERGAEAGQVKSGYRTNTADASKWFSSAAAFTSSSYGAGPEDKKHCVFFYTFEPSYDADAGTYRE